MRKSEARNPKLETNPNDQNAKFQTRATEFGAFRNSNFEFVSYWSETDASPDIRISDLF